MRCAGCKLRRVSCRLNTYDIYLSSIPIWADAMGHLDMMLLSLTANLKPSVNKRCGRSKNC